MKNIVVRVCMENTQHPNEDGGSNLCNVDRLSQKFYKNYKGLYGISPTIIMQCGSSVPEILQKL